MRDLSRQLWSSMTRGYLLLAVFTLASPFWVLANRDSLLSVVNNTNDEATKVAALLALGNQEIQDENFTLAIRFFRDAKGLYSDKYKWELERDILLGLWNAYYELGALDSAAVINRQLSDLCRIQGDADCLISNYNNQALLFYLQSQTDSAIITYQEGLKIAEALSDTASIALIYSNMGIVFGVQEHLDQALQYFYNSYNLCKQLGLDDLLITAQVNIARTYIEMQQLDSATIHLSNAKILATELDNQSSLRTILNFQGRTAMKLQQYELAQSNFEQLLADYSATEQLIQVVEVLTCLVETHIGKGDITVASRYCDQGINIAEELHLNEYLEDLYSFKSELLAENGKFEESLWFLRQHQELRDSFLNAANTAKMAEVVAKYDAVKKENENQLLRRQKEQQESKATQRTYLALAFGALSLLIAAVLLFRYRMYLSQKRSRLELEATVTARTEELRRINEQLQDSNQELRSFAYIASHDLKEPLRSISGFTSLLERRLKEQLNDETREYMAYIKKNTAHLHALIGDVLAYSLLTNEPLKAENVHLKKLVKDVKDNLAGLIKRKNGLVDCSGFPDKEIYTNYHHLFLIFKNLVENGLKYNDAEMPTVRLAFEESEDYIKVQFSDNGIGIAPVYHERIFELFKRLHNRETYQGTGMGLALSQKIANRLGGRIEVDSDEAQGSTFYLTIQKQKASET